MHVTLQKECATFFLCPIVQKHNGLNLNTVKKFITRIYTLESLQYLLIIIEI